MFLFPTIYIFFFFAAVYQLYKGRTDGMLLFVIFGLPIYITTLSITNMYGFGNMVSTLQACKEVVVLLAFASALFALRKKPKLHLPDWLVLGYFLYSFAYVLRPDEFTITEKLLALKSVSFFTFIYFTGRFIDLSKVNLSKYLKYICIVAFPAAAVVLFEVITYTHFQTHTGYADYMLYFFNQEPSGHHGLSWTFEAENDGPKRFASIFANPLDHAAGTLVCVTAIIVLITTDTKKVRLNNFILCTFICSLISIIFALSRASFASYFIILYAYAYITGRRDWIRAFYITAAAAAAAFLTWMQGDLYHFIIATVQMRDSSSASHLLEWLAGIQAMAAHPLGMGLGHSGRVATELGINIGGENQFIIIGVQTGILALATYIFIYIYLTWTAASMVKKRKGKARKVALFVLLIKLGLIIPFLTAEAESYVYIGYITWFLSGYMINIKYNTNDYRDRYQGPETGGYGAENYPGGTVPAIKTAG